MGDCPYPFAGTACPPSELPPDAIGFNWPSSQIYVSCDPDVLSGPLTAYTEWTATGGGAAPNPTQIYLSAGDIVLTNPDWSVHNPTNIAYAHGPVRYALQGGASLADFSLSIPWP